MERSDQQGSAGDLPELVVTMLTAIGRYFGADEGDMTLELRYGPNGFQKWWRHEQGGVSALERFGKT